MDAPKSPGERARLAVPARTMRSCRPASGGGLPVLRADPGDDVVHHGGRLHRTEPQQGVQQEAAEHGQLRLLDRTVQHGVPLVHPSRGQDEDHEHARGCEGDQFEVADRGAVLVGELRDGDLLGQLGQEAHRGLHHVLGVRLRVQQGPHGPALGGGQRLHLGEAVDEHAVALVRGDAPGGGVRGHDEALLLERSHVVAHGRGGHAQGVPFHERLGAHGLAQRHVVLHDRLEHLQAAGLLRHLGPPLVRRDPGRPRRCPWLALRRVKCQCYRPTRGTTRPARTASLTVIARPRCYRALPWTGAAGAPRATTT